MDNIFGVFGPMAINNIIVVYIFISRRYRRSNVLLNTRAQYTFTIVF